MKALPWGRRAHAQACMPEGARGRRSRGFCLPRCVFLSSPHPLSHCPLRFRFHTHSTSLPADQLVGLVIACLKPSPGFLMPPEPCTEPCHHAGRPRMPQPPAQPHLRPPPLNRCPKALSLTHTHTCAHARKHMRTRARPRPQGLHTRPSSWLCAQPTLSHLLPLGFSTTPWFVSVITPSTICFPFLVTASRVNPCPPHEATCAELSYPVVPPHQPGTVVNKPEPNK